MVGGLALGEEGGLALTCTSRLVKFSAKTVVLGLQVTEASLKGLAAGTRDVFHTLIVAKDPAGHLRQFHGEPGSA